MGKGVNRVSLYIVEWGDGWSKERLVVSGLKDARRAARMETFTGETVRILRVAEVVEVPASPTSHEVKA